MDTKLYLTWPIEPFQDFRSMDAWGGGSFGAPREGKDDGHPGVDIVGKPGDRVLMPMPSQIVHIGIAYKGEVMGSIHLKGHGDYEGWRIKLFYAQAEMPRYAMLNRGFHLGVLQDRAALATRRNPTRGPMINHLHLGLWIDGEIVDPTQFLRRPCDCKR